MGVFTGRLDEADHVAFLDLSRRGGDPRALAVENFEAANLVDRDQSVLRVSTGLSAAGRSTVDDQAMAQRGASTVALHARAMKEVLARGPDLLVCYGEIDLI